MCSSQLFKLSHESASIAGQDVIQELGKIQCSAQPHSTVSKSYTISPIAVVRFVSATALFGLEPIGINLQRQNHILKESFLLGLFFALLVADVLLSAVSAA